MAKVQNIRAEGQRIPCHTVCVSVCVYIYISLSSTSVSGIVSLAPERASESNLIRKLYAAYNKLFPAFQLNVSAIIVLY
jgi:hypothetical protein